MPKTGLTGWDEFLAGADSVVPTALASEARKADDADNKVVDLITEHRIRLGNVGPLQGSKALEVSLWATLKALFWFLFIILLMYQSCQLRGNFIMKPIRQRIARGNA